MKNFTIFTTSTNQRCRQPAELADKFAIEYHWFMVKNKQNHNTTLTQHTTESGIPPDADLAQCWGCQHCCDLSSWGCKSMCASWWRCNAHSREPKWKWKIAQAEAAAKEERLINNAKKYTQLCDFIMILCCRILLTRLTSPPTIIFNHVMIVYCSCYLSLIHMAMHLAVQVSCSWAERHTHSAHISCCAKQVCNDTVRALLRTHFSVFSSRCPPSAVECSMQINALYHHRSHLNANEIFI